MNGHEDDPCLCPGTKTLEALATGDGSLLDKLRRAYHQGANDSDRDGWSCPDRGDCDCLHCHAPHLVFYWVPTKSEQLANDLSLAMRNRHLAALERMMPVDFETVDFVMRQPVYLSRPHGVTLTAKDDE